MAWAGLVGAAENVRINAGPTGASLARVSRRCSAKAASRAARLRVLWPQ